MCGVTGVLHLDGQPVASHTVASMAERLAHRGPDGEGVWTEGPIGLGHRRLAIIDLTPAAHQPMTNEDGSLVITYNGELYNYQELRLELEAAGHRFHSASDTETVLHAYEQWGEACLGRFNGMFAFAIWNRNSGRLFLARDRFGVKPLYHALRGGAFLFASEIKALLAHPQMRVSICYPALNEYFTFQNVLSDRTLFDGIRLLPPGTCMTVALATGGVEQRRYWDYDFTAPPLTVSVEEAAEELYRLFVRAVTRQLVSDVPVGSYLSGGMDSGAITAVARRQLGRMMTFTCGFDLSSASGLELGCDERAQSEVLANLLKTEHYEMVMHAGDMEYVMPELIWHLEDLRVGQCYPNYYVARLAGKFIKVVLSGAGGDELFGGYPWRYYRGLRGNGGQDYVQRYYEFWQRLVPDEEKRSFFRPEAAKGIGDHSTFDAFRGVLGDAGLPMERAADLLNASLYFELKTFLHGLLVVEDRVSMAHSLETRVPFLDNEMVDFACRLPPEHKVAALGGAARVDENDVAKFLRTDGGKIVLRRAMQRVMPESVTARVKQGFSAPDASWFRGESIDYVNGLLRQPRARIYEFVEPEYVFGRLDEHGSGRHNHRLFIWSLLSFEWWLRRFLP
jgi:asparagine synthase (glutamine-hydrolysing)